VRTEVGILLILGLAVSALAATGLRGNLGIHDPSTIIKCQDKYYLFGTGNGILTKSSTDKVLWNAGPAIFARAPVWTTNAVPGFAGIFWAPDVFYLNGRYCLYYAVSTLGSQVSAIGLVTNPTLDPTNPSYQWTDQGPVIQSGIGSAYNTIDPSVTFDAAGSPWMSFGSYWNGIYIVQLDPLTGLRIAANSPTYRVAYNSSIEASCVFRRGGYYYLFADWGSCCSGVNSTYNVRLGRSTSITGPYLDRDGVDLAANGGTLFLQGTGKFTGPGHLGILSEGGAQYFSYHYYDAGAWAPWYNAYGIADFDLEPLSWTPDAWPVFTNDWSAVYRFQVDARDENGQYYGRLLNGASIQNDPARGRVLALNGSGQSVGLPAGVAYARTFVAVVKWAGGNAWQRIFDFGTDTTSYVMLTPLSGDGKVRCDIRSAGTTQSLAGPNPLPVGIWTQVAVTLDGQHGVLYVNGSPVATNNSMTLSPLDVLAQTNYLGHSKFAADPDFSGQIASFRAYGRVLSGAEIAAPLPKIAQPAEGGLYYPGAGIAFHGSATDLAGLPLGGSALSWRIDYSQDGRTNTVLGPLAGATNGVFNVPTNAAGGGTYRLHLTATDLSGRAATVSVGFLPAHPPVGWACFYPLRADARDANGHFDGALNGGASFLADPTRGTVLNLSGNHQFVSLPPGAASMQTFMAWVKWNGGNAWQRIFDFGNDTNTYGVLTPSAANGKLRFNLTVNSIGGEQVLDAPWPLPIGLWTHVAVTLDGSTAMLYTNGVPVATNRNVNLVPANLGSTNNYLGKSQWPDPYFNGQISAVRLLSRALSAAEIVAPVPVISQPAQGATYRPGDTLNFAGSASDFYSATLAATSFVWSVTWVYAGATNTVLGPVVGVTNGSFTFPSAGVQATNGFYHFALAVTDTAGRQAATGVDVFPLSAASTPADWASFYAFTSGAQDSSNRYPGMLINGASIQTDATRGKVLNLSGASQYVNLPGGVGGFQTISGWVKWNGGNPWQRVFDFGVDTLHFVMLTPLDGTGNMQCALTTDGSSYTQVIQGSTPLPIGAWTHLAAVFDGRQGILYTNGRVAVINNSINLLPSDVAATGAFLGRSQFTADPYFNGQVDSLKLNSRPLAPAELFAPTPNITLPTPGALFAGGDTINYAGTATDYFDAALPASAFTWSGEFHHDGLIDPVFGPITGSASGVFQIATTNSLSTNLFYRISLQVADAAGNQSLVSNDLLPRLAVLNLATVPPGLTVTLDAQPVSTPASLVAVAGMTRTVGAPSPQTLGGTNYSFVLWSDGGAAGHRLAVPPSNAVFTAAFVFPELNIDPGGKDGLTLAWPSWAAPLTLVNATNLMPPVAWMTVTNVPVFSNGWATLTLPLGQGNQFFRLAFIRSD